MSLGSALKFEFGFDGARTAHMGTALNFKPPAHIARPRLTAGDMDMSPLKEVLIGRANFIALTDHKTPMLTCISRAHLALGVNEIGTYVRDLSLLGTYVNGWRLVKGVPEYVDHSDVITLCAANSPYRLSLVSGSLQP